MNERINLFYEDAKKQKLHFLIFTILFYVGAAMGVFAIILYRLISPASLLAYYQPDGEDIIVTVLCSVFAICFNVFVVKAQRFKYYIMMTENEIKFFTKGKLYTYKIADLKKYEFVKEKQRATEIKLSFAGDIYVFIVTRKPQELKNILERIID